MISILAAAWIAGPSVGHAAFVTESTVVARLVNDVYRRYLAFVPSAGEAGGTSVFVKAHAKDFTPRFLKTVQDAEKICASKSGEIPEGCPDYDLVLCAQDVPRNASVKSVEILGPNAKAAVAEFDRLIDVELVRSKGGWRIDRIVCPN